MKEFILLFRNDSPVPKNSAEDIKDIAKKWQDWISGIAAQDKLVATGKQMAFTGKVIKPGNIITDGPYTEIKEMLVGQCTIKGENIDDAIETAKGCPILLYGGNVEIRELITY